MADLPGKAAAGVRRGLNIIGVKSRETVGVLSVRRQIARIEEERRTALEELGTTVCEMLEKGQLDEADLRTRCSTVAGLSERIREHQQEVEKVHERAAAELKGQEEA